jgi:hypothetical protein
MFDCKHLTRPGVAALVALALAACGSDDRRPQSATAGSGGTTGAGGLDQSGTGGSSGSGAAAGAAGAAGNPAGGSGAAGAAGAAGSGQNAGAGDEAGTAGESGSDGGTLDGSLGPIGTQPLGAVCANDLNCSQDQGSAVCCVNECRLSSECPGGSYLRCTAQSDCEAYGGGKVCCEAGGMRFCTKPSACDGQRIP